MYFTYELTAVHIVFTHIALEHNLDNALYGPRVRSNASRTCSCKGIQEAEGQGTAYNRFSI